MGCTIRSVCSSLKPIITRRLHSSYCEYYVSKWSLCCWIDRPNIHSKQKFLSILLNFEAIHADIALKVEYTPKNEVDLYQPFLIMISITNSGTKGELVPVTDNSRRGYRFYIRNTKTGEVYTNGLDGDRIGTRVSWIKPNDKYLFFEWVYYNIPIEGEFEIFAKLESGPAKANLRLQKYL